LNFTSAFLSIFCFKNCQCSPSCCPLLNMSPSHGPGYQTAVLGKDFESRMTKTFPYLPPATFPLEFSRRGSRNHHQHNTTDRVLESWWVNSIMITSILVPKGWRKNEDKGVGL
jgi:hypothetical protein